MPDAAGAERLREELEAEQDGENAELRKTVLFEANQCDMESPAIWIVSQSYPRRIVSRVQW